jgi:hypothetical protein
MKPKYKLDKRQKELARKQKQEKKKEAKLARKEQTAEPPAGDLPPSTD